MAIKPTRPTAPPQALRSDPATFSANAEASIAYQWTVLPDWIEGMGDFVDARADEALAAALGGDLPPLTGKALNMIRVNPGETAVEFRTPAQIVGDIGLSSLSGRNLVINGSGRVNQRGYISGTATVVANQDTLDRWRVVVSGQNLSFTGSDAGRIMTAPAGGVEQVVEGRNVAGGSYVLNWTGTATATVNGTARSKGVVFTLPANTNVTIRFASGTFSSVQLEAGIAATPFEYRSLGLELAMCQRYYEKTGYRMQVSGNYSVGHWGVEKGGTPNILISGAGAVQPVSGNETKSFVLTSYSPSAYNATVIGIWEP